MNLPLETTFAIFLGGVVRWLTDRIRDKRGLNAAQKARVDNAGVLTASGFIAGEALCGLVVAGLKGAEAAGKIKQALPAVFAHPSDLVALLVMAIMIAVLIKLPLANAGSPDEPAPPTAIM